MHLIEPLSATCQLALKEWASVLLAMARGEQLLLVRKGGLVEASRGFELRANTFLFYPTFEHQTVQYLRELYPRYLEEALRARAAQGTVRLETCGMAVASWPCNDPALLARLRDFHIYNDQFAVQRLKWQPDQPIIVVAVRVFRFGPLTVPSTDRYAGCKSWVELDAPISLAGARPVLDDGTFRHRLEHVKAVLG